MLAQQQSFFVQKEEDWQQMLAQGQSSSHTHTHTQAHKIIIIIIIKREKHAWGMENAVGWGKIRWGSDISGKTWVIWGSEPQRCRGKVFRRKGTINESPQGGNDLVCSKNGTETGAGQSDHGGEQKERGEVWEDVVKSLFEPTQFLFLLSLCVSCFVGDRITFFFSKRFYFFFLFLPKAPWCIAVCSSLWVLPVVACGTPPQRGLMNSVMSAPRIRTNETLGRLQRSART